MKHYLIFFITFFFLINHLNARNNRIQTEIERDGVKQWVEFDPVRKFNTEDEAKKYAEENGIADIKLQ